MTVKDIMDKIRHVSIVMPHNDENTKTGFVVDLTTGDLEQEFSWFEVTTFRGMRCIEFNI